jgi:hypothetical protein
MTGTSEQRLTHACRKLRGKQGEDDPYAIIANAEVLLGKLVEISSLFLQALSTRSMRK